MRLGLVADVHANLPALDAVLAALEREGVDAWVCPGDLVGYGPFPNECVRRVAQLGATCVAGNHDLIALGRLDDARCIPLARATLRWTARELDGEARAYLEALPLDARAAAGVEVAHGSPGDPEEYVRTPERAVAVLGEGILVLGHTHEAWAVGEHAGERLRAPATGTVSLGDDRWVLNPGSVGQSRDRDPRARAAVLDLERREATFVAVAYDTGATRAALRARGLPPDACHMRPRPLRRALGAVLRRGG